MPGPENLLILGGTGEARVLAEGAAAAYPDRLRVVSSLAGRLSRPPDLPGTVRVGGFGGAGGLARYLTQESIDMVVDATHPFAQGISANASEAFWRSHGPPERTNSARTSMRSSSPKAMSESAS